MEIVVDISGCADKDNVKFVSQSFKSEALTWWKAMIQSTGKIPLYNLEWSKFVDLIKETYCPQHEVEKVEKREDENSQKSKKKGKFGFHKKNHQGSDDRPVCKTCNRKHGGQCRQDQQAKPCGIYKKTGHKAIDCKDLKDAICYGCGEKGHIKTNCPKNAKKPGEAKKGNARAFQMNAREAVNDNNVITSTFLINDVYARVLFVSGADKSSVDLKFSKLLNLPIRTLDITYEIELADGTLDTASFILDGCSLSNKNHSIPFSSANEIGGVRYRFGHGLVIA
ncbi:uncharacterized protein LOC110882217 [Helianthus annuus]|uniref:uncharacterized protein LOC110882217 n=1 Tax=Helianthus annuus TaxID=4232 RepID=UPI000B905EF7|nr:uncharacterized protein LOC110882217 [Helianthus annuus]